MAGGANRPMTKSTMSSGSGVDGGGATVCMYASVSSPTCMEARHWLCREAAVPNRRGILVAGGSRAPMHANVPCHLGGSRRLFGNPSAACAFFASWYILDAYGNRCDGRVMSCWYSDSKTSNSSGDLAEAWGGVWRTDDRWRTRARRRPQLRDASADPRGSGGEAHDGARASEGHTEALARRRRGASGDEGLLHPCGFRCEVSEERFRAAAKWSIVESG